MQLSELNKQGERKHIPTEWKAHNRVQKKSKHTLSFNDRGSLKRHPPTQYILRASASTMRARVGGAHDEGWKLNRTTTNVHKWFSENIKL